MKLNFLATGLLAIVLGCSTSKPTEMIADPTTYTFLLGTYTDNESQGINQLEFTPESNTLEVRPIFSGIQNPSFVIANQSGDSVFSLEEINSTSGGNVVSFTRSAEDGNLTLINKLPTNGDHPCYLGLSPDEKFLVVGNYSGGNLSAYAVDEQGKLAHLQTIQHEGSSINKSRQESAHVHSTVFSPDGKHLLVGDLGTDQVYVYNFDKTAELPLSLNNTVHVNPGDGPRHIAFSKDGQELYVVEELIAALNIFSFDNGKISPVKQISLLSDGFEGEVGAAEVRVSPDGKNVYASNRGDANTISVLSKTASGGYEFTQQVSSGGETPRNFNLTHDGNYLLAANQASNTVVVFERNEETGMLSQTDWKVSVHKPVYLFEVTD